VAGRSYAELIPEIRNKLRARSFAGTQDKLEIGYRETNSREQGFRKEVSFHVPHNPISPELSTVYFRQDGAGNLWTGTWQYQTRIHTVTQCGSEKVIRVSDSEWELQIDQRDGRDYYTLRTKSGFVGAVKITVNGKSFIVYTHGDTAEKPPTAEQPPLKGPAPSTTPALPRRNSDSPVLPPNTPSSPSTQLPSGGGAANSNPDPLKAERDALQQQRETLAAEKKALEEQRNELAQRERAVRAREQRNTEQEQQLAALQKRLDEQQRQQTQHQQELTTTASGLEQMRTQQKQRKAELEQLAGNLNSLSAELAAQKKDQDDTQRQLSSWKKELSDLAGALAGQQKALEEERSRLGGLRTQAEKRAEAQRKRDEELAGLRESLDTQSDALGQRQKDADAAQADLDRRKKELDARADLDGRVRGELNKKLEQEAETLQREREQLARQRKELDDLRRGLEQEQKSQAAAKADLEKLRTTLAERGTHLDGQQTDLEAKAQSLAALAAQLDAREKALKQREAAQATPDTGPLRITVSAPADQPAQPVRPTLRWEYNPLASPHPDSPVRLPDIRLPAWLQLATSVNFDRAALERAFTPAGYEDFLAAGDEKDRKAFSERIDAATGDARTAFENDRRWFEVNIDQAYKPIIGSYSGIQDCLVLLARYGALEPNAKPRWNETEKKEVRERIQYALAAYRTAVSGRAPKDRNDWVPNEEQAGGAAKLQQIRQRIDRLVALGEKRSPAETRQLGFLQQRAARMDEFVGLLTALRPYVDRLEQSAVAMDNFSALTTIRTGQPANGPQYGKENQPLIDKLFSGSPNAADVDAARRFFDQLAGVSSTNPQTIAAAFGSPDQLQLLHDNLQRVLNATERPEYAAQCSAPAKKALWDRTTALLAENTSPADKQKAVIEYFTQTLGRPLTKLEADGISYNLDLVRREPDQTRRASRVSEMIQPLLLHIESGNTTQRAALQDSLKKAIAQLDRCGKTLQDAKRAQETDRAYLAFTGSIPSFADPDSSEKYFALPPERRQPIDAEIAKRQAAAVSAIRAEITALAAYEGKAETADNRYYVSRLQQLKNRLRNIDLWQEDRNR
jgi:hypothetical protein